MSAAAGRASAGGAGRSKTVPSSVRIGRSQAGDGGSGSGSAASRSRTASILS